MSQINALVLGASYGLLPALRILLAGHRVTVVCRPQEQSALATHGASIAFLRRNGETATRLSAPAVHTTSVANDLGVCGAKVDLGAFDIVFLAMSEPQFADAEIAALVKRIAQAGLPVISLMNALPPPFLDRLGTLDVDKLRGAYTSWAAWQSLSPDLVSAASPDAQAVRSDPARLNELSVTLASNFKVAPFAAAKHQDLIETIASDVSAYRYDGRPLPVRILAHTSLHVPLAKWPMLTTGNCRCLRSDGSIVSISRAVEDDIATSNRIYDRTVDIVKATGAADGDIVPFEHYAKAARSLSRPSSFARAIAAGAARIERVDRMVQLCGRSLGIEVPEIDRIVTQVDRALSCHEIQCATPQ
ncbi:ketopantoate reductase family protein [Tropicimonas marinistellae]|uniref:ketopantoate reductase family protein n=1 Tax=Tropicimonas marinistellae TaxID=1739787 RepID=UPI0008355C5C|nr:hypothetical protein [Tropicimonas marinistellae]